MMSDDQDFVRELRLRCLKLAIDAYPALMIDGVDATDATHVVTVASAFEVYVLSGDGHQPLEPGAARRD